MIEHNPWVPEGYTNSNVGQRVAICGFSHYDGGDESECLTHQVVRDVVSGTGNHRFFLAIAKAFDQGPAELFSRAIFFNFLPSSVGDAHHKFAAGSAEQHFAGRDRVLRIIETHSPDKLFVFSSKAWNSFPKTDQELAGLPHGKSPAWGTYSGHGGLTYAIAMRHPQGASSAVLRDGVRFGLALGQ